MPQSDDLQANENTYGLPAKKEKVVQPLHDLKATNQDDDVALNLIRQKLTAIYDEEPDTKKELAEDRAHHGRRSKHQEYMHQLSSSGKSLAEIQIAWHEYYIQLPDNEKHQVWQEFYSNYNRSSNTRQTPSRPRAEEKPQRKPQHTFAPEPSRAASAQQSAEAIKQHIRSTVKDRAANNKHHLSSLKFGLATGLIVTFIMLFGFFNERFVAPLITPSTRVSSTPLILDENGAVGSEPKLIIPKINVEAPIVLDETSIAEDAVQEALEDGVLHYATTPKPGELGNSVIFGHSSNNILNEGDYKYVFVLLNKLENGDTFFVHKDGKRYTYKVYDKKIVSPEEVSVLGDTEKKASMTLITCDPPGTAINRLVVFAEQINPSPNANVASTATNQASVQPNILPSNAPSLWDRFTSWLTS